MTPRRLVTVTLFPWVKSPRGSHHPQANPTLVYGVKVLHDLTWPQHDNQPWHFRKTKFFLCFKPVLSFSLQSFLPKHLLIDFVPFLPTISSNLKLPVSSRHSQVALFLIHPLLHWVTMATLRQWHCRTSWVLVLKQNTLDDHAILCIFLPP